MQKIKNIWRKYESDKKKKSNYHFDGKINGLKIMIFMHQLILSENEPMITVYSDILYNNERIINKLRNLNDY